MRRGLVIAAQSAAVAALAAPVAAFGQASPSAFTSATRYDADRQIVGTIAPDPDGAGPLKFAAVRNTYDVAGRLVLVEKGELANWQAETVAPVNWTGFTVFEKLETTYDPMDRKLKESASGWDTSAGAFVTKRVTQYSYTMGRLECTAVRMNPAVFASLPASACTLGTTGSDGPDRITRQVHDAVGQLLNVQKAYGVTTANGFPVTLEQDYVAYTYTDNGKQKTVVDANGNKAEMVYDGHDRQVAWVFPSKTTLGETATCNIGTVTETGGIASPSETRNTTDDCEKYGWDRNGNRTKLIKRDGRVLSYSYDALNRNTVKIVPDTCPVAAPACTTAPASAVRDVYYAYDLRGLQLYARFDSHSGAEGVLSSYDGFGRLKTSTNTMGGTSRLLTYEWDADGNRTAVTHPDGNPTTYANAFKYEYDGLDRLVAIKENGTTTIASLVYDTRGNRQSLTRGGVVTSYVYDPVSRPASMTDELSGTASDQTSSFTYNPASQIRTRGRTNTAYAFPGYVNVNRPYARNGLNQYTSAGSATFTYDANGNLTGDGINSYTYDVENRLISASAGLNAQLIYDPLGRLFSAGVSGVGKQWLYDGDELIAEYNPAAPTTVNRRYVHGAAEDDPWFHYSGSGVSSAARMSLQSDHQGSIVSIADATGAMVAINEYDEYGIPASGNAGRFQYTGQAWLSEIGMYYYKARIYSPTLGRFLQTDPIGYKDQVNLYVYVSNDPVSGRDPSGAYSCKEKECSKIEAIISRAKSALNQPATGSRLRSASASAGLSALNALGKNDGTGVAIQGGSLSGPELGSTSGSTSITLDFDKIQKVANSWGVEGLSVAAGVLGHEASHYEERAFDAKSGYQRIPSANYFMNSERRAWDIQLHILAGLGTTAPWRINLPRGYPRPGDPDYALDLNDLARQNCRYDLQVAGLGGSESCQ